MASQETPAAANMNNNQNNKKTTLWKILAIIATAASIVGLYLLSRYSYLLFHNTIEIFTIVIAFAISAIAWNSRRIADNNYFLFIGIAFLFVGGLDLLHTLSYKGMDLFPGFNGSNLATQLWIATRYVFALTLLFALLLARRKIKPTLISATYAITFSLLIFSIFYWKNFPQAYVENVGLTTFKVASEFAISAILLVSIFLLNNKKKEFSSHVFKMIIIGTILAIATEMAFTLYSDVYGIANLVGHLLDAASFYFIYLALIQTSLTRPYELLFRNLTHSQAALSSRAEELTKANQKLQKEISEKEAAKQALKENEERLQLKLDSVLSPDIELEDEELINILDIPMIQATMDHLYALTKMGFALVDLKGKVLIETGWQDICTKFHRVNPITCKNCIESDLELTRGLNQSEIRLYKCKNNMWDVVTPLFIADKHVGNVFFGQFFFDDEIPNRDFFANQAKKYGFNIEEYLDAFERIPKYSREKVEELIVFYSRLSEMISKISYSNLKLAKSLINQKQLQEKLENKASEVEEFASQMEELAEERAKKLKDAERLAAIGQTAGMVGHDIRNPLQAITSELYLQSIEIEKLPQGEGKQNLIESINGIEENLFYINKIVADLQDFARPLNPKKEQVDLGKAIEDALAIVSVPNNIKTSIMNESNLPLITVDSTMLQRILVNLIQNAVQAMQNGGTMSIKTTTEKSSIILLVQDTGCGIPVEVQDKIFTPLVTTKSKGQGFGLAVVKRMTEAMGGTITFESELGKGTKFCLEFPK
jgi:signal transduction histidine kinase